MAGRETFPSSTGRGVGGAAGYMSGLAHGAIRIDTSQAQQAPAAMQGVAAGINRAMGSVDAGINKAQASINRLKGVLRDLAGAFGVSLGVAGGVQIAKMVLEMGKLSAQAEGTRDSFESLAAGVGQSADQMLESMKKASRGTISDAQLILNANRAISSGVADTSAEINQLLEVARALGRAYGFSTAEAFDRIIRSVSKLEPELLDELNITMRLDTVFRAYAATLGTTADKLTEAQRRQAMLNELLRQSQDEVDAARKKGDTAADSYDRLGASWDNATKAIGDFINASGGALGASLIVAKVQREQALLEGYIDLLNRAKNAVAGFLGMGSAGVSGTAPWGTRGAPPGVASALPDPNAPAIAQAELDWAEGVQNINKRLHADIIDAEKSYGRSRQSAIEQYQLGITREQQDFAISRQRQEQELADSILRINRDAARREQRMAEDLARGIARAEADSSERVANARRDHDKRLAEMDEDFKRNQERREEDFRDDMLSAAGRLDAIALLELRKGRARELKDAQQAHEEQRRDLDEQLQERLDDEAESLDKSIRQQREAYDRQLQDAREADAERLADMQADFAKRQEQEDVDRAIRLQRQAQDHDRQLAEMDREHASRLAQIHIHAQDERDELDMQHKLELKRLKAANDEMLKEIERVEKARRKIYDDVWELDPAGRRASHPSENDPYIGRNLPGYAMGGYVPRTGLAMLHAGETVLPASQSWNMGGSRGPISIGEISIAIAGTTDMGPGELRPMIYEVLVDALEQVAGRR